MSKLIILKSISLNTFIALMLSSRKQSDSNQRCKIAFKIKKLKSSVTKIKKPKKIVLL